MARRKAAAGGLLPRLLAAPEAPEASGGLSTGTSIFDPVLCEVVYRWFSAPGAMVLDPFSGGSVRGVVASKLGRRYLGCDLSARQVAANIEQGAAICDPAWMPIWLNGDSQDIERLVPAGFAADLIFSCPPYASLEVYSDDPLDLSTMSLEAFTEAYREIIAAALRLLKPDRFAAFVIGDVRDKGGFYMGLPWRTIAAFEDAGARLYNQAILVTAVGSLPVRVSRYFESSRKLGNTHQHLLIFCNGDPRRAAEACGAIDEE